MYKVGDKMYPSNKAFEIGMKDRAKGKHLYDNPYSVDFEPHLWQEWERGFSYEPNPQDGFDLYEIFRP